MSSVTEQQPVPSRPLWRRAAAALAFFAILAAVVFSGIAEDLSWDGLRARHGALKQLVESHYLLSAGGFVLIYVLAVSFSVPGAVWLTIAGGLLFSAVPATLMVVMAATLGACAIFLLARYVMGDVLRAKAGSAIARMEEGFRRDAFNYMLVLRLVPLFPFFLVNLVPAFLGVRLRTFAAATFIGIIPGTFVFAALGAGLGDAIESGSSADPARALMQPGVIGALVGLAILALVPVVYRRWKA
ncbi:MAG: VTT domain-containing protein [Rhodospirillaceae bacterium]|nr:VTT domain-containing protein [Rhodospirillaceae bacterium]